MADERKPGGGAGKGRPGPRSGKPFAGKPDGGKSFRPKGDGPKSYRARPADGDKPYRAKPAEGAKPYRARPADGDKPYRAKPAGEPRTDFERKSGAGGEGRPFTPREDRPRFERDDNKPFRPKSGERSGDKPFRGGDKPFVKRDGPSKPFARDAGKKPFASRTAPEAEPGERIAKRLARAGIASRRDAEELIAAGRVTVNGKVLSSPAVNVSIEDEIAVDGTSIPPIERTRLFLFNKPAGVVTTNRDPEGRKTVFDTLPADLPRLITVGRLDINTEGLLLLTNDGGLARMLELPATGWLRRYRARVHGKVDEKALPALKDGMAVDGVFYGSIEASLDREKGSNAWMTIGLREGKNREVKNILGALGLDVTRLIRISYGPFQLGELPEGHVLEIKGRTLRDQLGERLIEESGANFEAPIVKPFSNEPTRRARDETPVEPERPRPARDGERGRIGEGGLIKRRQRREGQRDEALGKLSTRPERSGPRPTGDAGRPERGPRPPRDGERPQRGARPPRGDKPDRNKAPLEPPGQRKTNIWMAPGARPIGTGRLAREKAEHEERKSRNPKPFAGPRDGAAKKPYAAKKPFGAGKPSGGDRPSGADKPFRKGPGDRPTRPRKDGDADRRR